MGDSNNILYSSINFPKLKTLLSLTLSLLLCSQITLSQTKESQNIKNSIIDFLKWHKANGEYVSGEVYFVPRYDSLDSKITYFDKDSLELYYNNFRASKFVSERFIYNLKDYFDYYGKSIGPKRKPGEIVKIDGLDRDIVLNTFEPEEILDHLDKAKLDKIHIIYYKALVRLVIKKEIKMLFILTKVDNKWLIDYLGYDNGYKYSFGKQ